MTQRYFSSTAGQMVLQSSISSASTTITVDTTTGLPGTTPFTLVLDAGTSIEEIVDCTGVSGTTLTITRGIDGSPATAHNSGAFVRHMAIARDYREANTHINSTSAHGTSSAVVGVSDSQSLTNKDLTSGTNTLPANLVTTTGTQNVTNKTALAASAATIGLTVKGASAQSASYLEVQDTSGLVLVKITPDINGNVQFDGGTVTLNAGALANFASFVAKFKATTNAVVSAIFQRASSGSTADIVQITDQTGAVLAKFDSAGKLTTPQVTSTGTVTGTNLPALVQSGQASITLPSAANNISQALTFPSTFAGTPRVTVSLSNLPGGSSKATVRTVSTSSTATTLWVENGDGTNFGVSVPVTVDWIAVF